MGLNVKMADLPVTVKGFVVKNCDDGEPYYTIVINSRLSVVEQKNAIIHEYDHIIEEDFEKFMKVAEIENLRHRKGDRNNEKRWQNTKNLHI